MSRRGYLVKPDPALAEPCARPGCGHTEGRHLLCGCRSFRDAKPCECPGFAIEAPQCPHCRRYFDTVWQFDLHMKVLRFLDPRCRGAERQSAAAAESRRATKAFLDRAKAIR